MKKRLLIIEDDIDIRESLQEFLRSEGYGVETAENGADALRLLSEAKNDFSRRFDLILLDLMMPVMNGIEFRKRQTADADLAKLPVIVISADNRTRTIAADIGLHRCVLKPMNLDDLTAAIEEASLPDPTPGLRTEAGVSPETLANSPASTREKSAW